MDKNLKKRSVAEKKFRFYGLLSVLIALSLLTILFISIIHEGKTAFIETKIKINADFDEKIILNSGRKNIETIQKADFNKITKKSLSDRKSVV